ncbi:MAG: hypothetical protein KGI80_06015 [Verrucomicrobiota bacterium]|nr:hypothetical protein [Verrucomicrobiota bacterium]
MKLLIILFLTLASLFATTLHAAEEVRENGYTINYDTVSIVEYIRFASKICGINFIFEADELNFTISVVSDAPITPDNVMATLLQTLRIHGLELLEQEGNIVIHKAAGVQQMATVVTESGQGKKFPLVTRVFRLSRLKAETALTIIRPMVSQTALLEASTETKQLIVTDITANVDKIAALLEILDSSETPLEVRSYQPLHNTPELLVQLCTQIMEPLAQGTPFTLVVQKASHAIFIVSTPLLVNQAVAALKSLDVPPAAEEIHPSLSNELYSYKPKHIRAEELAKTVHELAIELKEDRFADPAFLQTLRSAKYIPTTETLLFTGDSQSLKKLEPLLATLDIAPTVAPLAPQKKDFALYALQHVSEERANQYLNQLAENLRKQGGATPAFLTTIEERTWIANSRSFLFSGSQEDLDKIQQLLRNFDTPEAAVAKPGYVIYKLQHITTDQMEQRLDKFAHDLEKAGPSGEALYEAIEEIKYVPETNSLVLTGKQDTLTQLKDLIAEYDQPQPALPVSNSFFMYKPRYLSAPDIEKSLQDIGTSLEEAHLADPSLLQTIRSARYVSATNSIIFTGNADSLQKVQALLQDVDIPPTTHIPIQHVGKTTFLLYKLKHAGGPQIVSALQSITTDLAASGEADKDFLSALRSVKYIKETNSLLFTGKEESLSRVETLVNSFDLPSLAPVTPQGQTPALVSQGPVSTRYLVYRPLIVPGPDLERMMQDFASNLKMSGLSDPDLFNAIASMRWVEKTSSLIFTGTQPALDQVNVLLKDFDIPANVHETLPVVGSGIQAIDNTSFLVYKLQFHRGDEIQGALRQIAKDLVTSEAPVNQNLLNAIRSIQWLDVTNSLLCSGDPETLTRLKELVKNLDIPLKQVFIEILVIETSLTNALNFGLEWGSNYQFNERFGATTYNTTEALSPDAFVSNLSKLQPPLPPNPVGNIPPSTGFDLGVIGEVIKHKGKTFLTLGSLLTALQTDNETTIVNTPKILTQDGRTSVFFSGSNIPFTGSFVNNTQIGATILTSNLEYRDIGLKLTLTPVLGNSNIVTLDINLDREQTTVNNQTQLNFQSQTANGIITSKTSMQTTVHVPDRNFLILSGFVNNSNTKQKTGIPCLGGLPMLGAAFSHSADTVSTQNIVIFLRPYILNSLEDMQRVTGEQEEFFRDQSATPFLEHNYNESIELLKTIDDE